MKKVLIICMFLLSTFSHAENWQVDWYGSARIGGTSGQYMPFWARTGEDGILPVASSGLVTAGADAFYKAGKGFSFSAGLNLAGAVAQKSPVNSSSVYGLIDRMYVSANWKMLHFDAGLKPRERTLSDISVSGGNVVYSRNARNMPGINAWSDWIYFERGHWVGIKGNLAHYFWCRPRNLGITRIQVQSNRQANTSGLPGAAAQKSIYREKERQA